MKSLLLLRHAKAEASSEDGRDISRPLAERGKRDAGMMGKALRKMELIPEAILASPSRRTRETVDYLVEKLKGAPVVEYEEGIYEATWPALQAIVAKKGRGECFLMVGHNPGFEELVPALSGDAGQMYLSLPTCGMARIDFEIEAWSEVEQTAGKLVWLINPEMLRDVT